MSSAVQSAYEKMLQNPDNRVSSSGTMKQPMPSGRDTGGADMTKIPEQKIDPHAAEENSYLAGVDARMAARQQGAPVNENTNSLEKRVKEIEELLV
jgi:hypothetical protein